MAGITVLLLDADGANRNFLAQQLQKKSYQVERAHSGHEGIQRELLE